MQFEVLYRTPEETRPQKVTVSTFEREPLTFSEAAQSVNAIRKVLRKTPIQISDVISSKELIT